MTNNSLKKEVQDLQILVESKLNDLKAKQLDKFNKITSLLEGFFYKLSEEISLNMENKLLATNNEIEEEIKEIYNQIDHLEKKDEELNLFLQNCQLFLKK